MLEIELETIENHIFTHGAQRANIERLYALKAKVLMLRHAVMPLLEAIGKPVRRARAVVLRRYPGIFPRRARPPGAHRHPLDTIRDTIGTAIQVNLSMVAIDESEVNKRLAAWAAIFAVFTAFAGVWGMNFEFMPELEWHWGYPMAVGVMVLVCFYMHRRFKKSGWL